MLLNGGGLVVMCQLNVSIQRFAQINLGKRLEWVWGLLTTHLDRDAIILVEIDTGRLAITTKKASLFIRVPGWDDIAEGGTHVGTMGESAS
eukprot:EC839022.1.p4 GENE.EC839022.1~~EC839022.1.p4  ORF type:complete len:91 (-),score=1.93 EC839022.1:375-647(-)